MKDLLGLFTGIHKATRNHLPNPLLFPQHHNHICLGCQTKTQAISQNYLPFPTSHPQPPLHSDLTIPQHALVITALTSQLARHFFGARGLTCAFPKTVTLQQVFKHTSVQTGSKGKGGWLLREGQI